MEWPVVSRKRIFDQGSSRRTAGWGSRADNWPIASYGRGLLEYGMRDRFDKVLKAMLDHYLAEDTFTAYEQVFNEGNPRRPGAPACVPAQLAFPRMLAWSVRYEPWKVRSTPWRREGAPQTGLPLPRSL